MSSRLSAPGVAGKPVRMSRGMVHLVGAGPGDPELIEQGLAVGVARQSGTVIIDRRSDRRELDAEALEFDNNFFAKLAAPKKHDADGGV